MPATAADWLTAVVVFCFPPGGDESTNCNQWGMPSPAVVANRQSKRIVLAPFFALIFEDPFSERVSKIVHTAFGSIC